MLLCIAIIVVFVALIGITVLLTRKPPSVKLPTREEEEQQEEYERAKRSQWVASPPVQLLTGRVATRDPYRRPNRPLPPPPASSSRAEIERRAAQDRQSAERERRRAQELEDENDRLRRDSYDSWTTDFGSSSSHSHDSHHDSSSGHDHGSYDSGGGDSGGSDSGGGGD